jgi:hypothetical protein
MSISAKDNNDNFLNLLYQQVGLRQASLQKIFDLAGIWSEVRGRVEWF